MHLWMRIRLQSFHPTYRLAATYLLGLFFFQHNHTVRNLCMNIPGKFYWFAANATRSEPQYSLALFVDLRMFKIIAPLNYFIEGCSIYIGFRVIRSMYLDKRSFSCFSINDLLMGSSALLCPTTYQRLYNHRSPSGHKIFSLLKPSFSIVERFSMFRKQWFICFWYRFLLESPVYSRNTCIRAKKFPLNSFLDRFLLYPCTICH